MLGTVMASCQLRDSGSKAFQSRAKSCEDLGVLSMSLSARLRVSPLPEGLTRSC